MPIILVLIGVIGLGVFWGYPQYQLMQLENEMRTNLKSGGFSSFVEQAKPVMQAMKLDFSVLDQYPHIRFYMRNTLYTGKDLPDGVTAMVKTMSCNSIDSFRTMESTARTALLNVLEEDQITFHVSVKNRFGAELATHQQKMAECPNFLQLKHYKEGDPLPPMPSLNHQVPSVAPAVSTSTQERAASY